MGFIASQTPAFSGRAGFSELRWSSRIFTRCNELFQCYIRALVPCVTKSMLTTFQYVVSTCNILMRLLLFWGGALMCTTASCAADCERSWCYLWDVMWLCVLSIVTPWFQFLPFFRPKIDSPLRLAFAPSPLKQLLVVTRGNRLLKLDSKTGRLLSVDENMHRWGVMGSVCVISCCRHFMLSWVFQRSIIKIHRKGLSCEVLPFLRCVLFRNRGKQIDSAFQKTQKVLYFLSFQWHCTSTGAC